MRAGAGQGHERGEIFVNFNDSQAALVETLGRFPDKHGAAAVARFLPDHFCRDAASQSLQKMGPAAEKAVLVYYNHKDRGGRQEGTPS